MNPFVLHVYPFQLENLARLATSRSMLDVARDLSTAGTTKSPPVAAFPSSTVDVEETATVSTLRRNVRGFAPLAEDLSPEEV